MLFARIFRFLIGLAFCINLVLLLVALSAPYYNPKYVWVPSFIGLFFKVFVLSHLFFALIFFIGRLWRLLIFALAVLLFCIPALVHTVGFRFGHREQATNSNSLKLMTYNVNSFDFYKDSIYPLQILKTISSQAPDVICFQEYMMTPAQRKNLINRLQQSGYVYYYEYITEIIKPHNKVGQAIYSKIPFYNVQPIHFQHTSNGAFSVDLPFHGDTVRLFNVHFQSISLSDYEFKIPSSLDDFKDPQIDYYRMFFTKFMWAFRKRSYQAMEVKQYAENSPYKVVICGDFNDTPVSFVYRELTQKLNDTFLETNLGWGTTFAGKIPFQRIDYVLTDPAIKCDITRVLHVPGSDHYPVVSILAIGGH